MRHPGHRNHDNPWDNATPPEVEIGIGVALILDTLKRLENTMATKDQLDKLTTDVAALIDAGVAEITAAIAAAQKDSPDPAIDTLDVRVTAATKGLTDAAAALANPPA